MKSNKNENEDKQKIHKYSNNYNETDWLNTKHNHQTSHPKQNQQATTQTQNKTQPNKSEGNDEWEH